jgi:hypothetical protein
MQAGWVMYAVVATGERIAAEKESGSRRAVEAVHSQRATTVRVPEV